MKNGFDASKLDKAMIEIKKELAELKQKQGQLATKEDIECIINEALKNNSLQNVISQDQINALVAFAQNYQNTSAIDSKQVLEQLNNLSKSVSEKINSLVEQAKNEGGSIKSPNSSNRFLMPSKISSHKTKD